MTRITNFGRKRTYLQSTSGYWAKEGSQGSPSVAVSNEASEQPPKKKRKRTKKSQRTGNASNAQETSNDHTPPVSQPGPSGDQPQLVKSTQKRQKKSKKDKHRQGKRIDKDAAIRSESRRLNRIMKRNVDTTCFACREKGHSAKDCPKEGGDKKSVGICYRCGSSKHNLSLCKKPEDLLDPLPFATCFVCNGKGHLASGCSQNKDKGVYPNGGFCKLCGDTSHLAKNCGIRKRDANTLTQVIGVERDIGGDEDDFHIIGRRKQELDKEEKRDEKIHKSMNIKVGAQSGVMKSCGKVTAPQAKTVVYF
ncbi:hypothetical protein E1B28_000933 [Marasmius oreades]|uniref:CCHC-type domain-containing protein n=1 Tax=Marasmius oreades TaxID=181124 RepID=A0A9P8AF07_9AGAR|nr:uncharacterized protein E1B28_000933 [Marasmius oreades]KAG7099058.1 hypothetical protein E1B28_000933 [Marasmius oreades]